MLKGMREEASFHMFFEKVRASAQKLEVNDPKLPRKRKGPSRYENGEAPAEFVPTVEEHYRQIFTKQSIWLPTVFMIDFSRKITSKHFRQWRTCF